MVEKTTYSMKFRRRKEGKTDYRKRLALLKSRKDRLVVRVLSRQVTAQIISYKNAGDVVKASATSLELRKYGWKGATGNAPAAYLTGMLIGYKAKGKNIGECVLDIGLHTPVNGSNVFAALKGAVDAGLNIPHSEDAFPPEDRISGKSFAEYSKKPDTIKEFETVKAAIQKEFAKG